MKRINYSGLLFCLVRLHTTAHLVEGALFVVRLLQSLRRIRLKKLTAAPVCEQKHGGQYNNSIIGPCKGCA